MIENYVKPFNHMELQAQVLKEISFLYHSIAQRHFIPEKIIPTFWLVVFNNSTMYVYKRPPITTYQIMITEPQFRKNEDSNNQTHQSSYESDSHIQIFKLKPVVPEEMDNIDNLLSIFYQHELHETSTQPSYITKFKKYDRITTFMTHVLNQAPSPEQKYYTRIIVKIDPNSTFPSEKRRSIVISSEKKDYTQIESALILAFNLERKVSKLIDVINQLTKTNTTPTKKQLDKIRTTIELNAQTCISGQMKKYAHAYLKSVSNSHNKNIKEISKLQQILVSLIMKEEKLYNYYELYTHDSTVKIQSLKKNYSMMRNSLSIYLGVS